MPYFRVVYQQEQEDCGAACLAMITRFYGFHVTLEAIKAFCGNMKSGLTMLGLNHAAKRIGFHTQAVRLNEQELFNLPLDTYPFVTHWNQNHFVVVYKATSKYVYVADPAIGRVRYKHQEFLEGFATSDDNDGFALLLKPNEIDIQILHQKTRDGLKLLDYIKPRKQIWRWKNYHF